jgi:hypothetical protein
MSFDSPDAICLLRSVNLKNKRRMSEIVDIGRMPTSSRPTDLRRMGHKLNGFFLVKVSKKVEWRFTVSFILMEKLRHLHVQLLIILIVSDIV